MLFLPGRMVLPWALLLLLLNCQILAIPVLYRQEKTEQHDKKDQNDQDIIARYFPPTLEFAVYKFNLLNKEKSAYRVLNVLSVKREKVDFPVVFSMKVTLGRTKCSKFEENIDNCPFHETPGMVNLLETPVSRATIENMRNAAIYFPATVEFALHSFNQQSKDELAYRLVHVLDSWRTKPGDMKLKRKDQNGMLFSMKLKLRRTKCGKFEDDIENCPFQDSSELNNTFICYFIISIKSWKTEFGLLNKTCSEELPQLKST